MSRLPSSPLATTTVAAIAAAAAVLGAAPWFAGRHAVLQAEDMRLLVAAAAGCGIAAATAAVLLKRSHASARAAALPIGVLAVSSSLAFAALLSRQQPGEPRAAGIPAAVPGTEPATVVSRGGDRLRVLVVGAGQRDRDGGRRPLPDRVDHVGRLTEAIEMLRPDVVFLRQAWCAVGDGCLVDLLAETLGLHAVFVRASGSLRWLGFEEGPAMLSRFPIAVPQVRALPPDQNRRRGIALAADIKHPALRFEVVGVYRPNGGLIGDDSSSDARALVEASSDRLLAQLVFRPARPALIVGDPSLDRGGQVLARFRQAGYRDLVGGGIDRLLLDVRDSGWWPLWAERGASGRSGIVAEFQLPVPPTEDRRPGDWRLVPAGRVGLDAERLEAAVEAIAALHGVRGVLVARRGRLVAERYAPGASPQRMHNLKSASKSVLSALAGLAVEQGVFDLDQPIADFLPEAAELDDPRKAAITVRHLLTMTSGLESTSFDNYGPWVASRNWVRAALSRPLQAAPGSRFSYSTGGTHLLSATLSRAAGKSARDFAREHLFTPLGIQRSAWARDPQGIPMGGNNLFLLPRDLLKFGQLYLNRGRFDGRQILPWQWVDQSTRPGAGLAGPRSPWRESVQHRERSGARPARRDEGDCRAIFDRGETMPDGMHGRSNATRLPPRAARGRGRIYGGYGFLWWLRPPAERGAYLASGYGGQYVYVAPAERLVVVVLSTEASKGRGWRGELFGLVRGGIAGSVIDRYER